jgi:hypothetical protein
MIIDLYLKYLNEQNTKSFWRRERERVRQYSKKLPSNQRSAPFSQRREKMWKDVENRKGEKFFTPFSQR